MTMLAMLVAAALTGWLHAADSSKAVTATVEHLKIVPIEVNDPEVSAYKLTFALRVRNGSSLPIALSTRDIFITGVQVRTLERTWRSLNQSSWYDDGTTDYAACVYLRPGESLITVEVTTQILLLKSQLRDLPEHPTPTLRLQAEFVCKRSDGRVALTKVLNSEPFVFTIGN
jgi:hypothetical protein